MAKLTETTNDQLTKRRGRPPKNLPIPSVGNGNGGLHIVAAHEPVKNDAFFPPPPMQSFQLPPAITTAAPLRIAPMAEPKILKVACVGTAPSSRMLAPYADTSWTIWGCSPGNMKILPRVDAWFEIHGSLLWPENKHYGEPYLAWLNEQKIPVYMQDQRYLPQAISLPLKELVKEFGPYYFTSSFAWMMAMAMHMGAKEIALYGIDMASRDEYILQRPGAYHFFQEAKRRGVKMSAPYESDIMQPPGLYGFSETTPFGRKMIARQQEIKERIAGLKAQRDQTVNSLSNQITYLEGALEDLDYIQSIWGGIQNNSGLDIQADP